MYTLGAESVCLILETCNCSYFWLTVKQTWVEETLSSSHTPSEPSSLNSLFDTRKSPRRKLPQLPPLASGWCLQPLNMSKGFQRVSSKKASGTGWGWQLRKKAPLTWDSSPSRGLGWPSVPCVGGGNWLAESSCPWQSFDLTSLKWTTYLNLSRRGQLKLLIGVQHILKFWMMLKVIRKKSPVLLPSHHTHPSETMTDRWLPTVMVMSWFPWPSTLAYPFLEEEQESFL